MSDGVTYSIDSAQTRRPVATRRLQLATGTASVLLVVVCGLVAADLVWTLTVGPTLEAPRARQSRPATGSRTTMVADTSILGRFDPFFREIDRTAPAVEQQEEAAPETSLSLKLYGVRASGERGLGTAIIEDPRGRQSSYAIGEEIINGVRLTAVYPDYVEINRAGVRESLYFPGGKRQLQLIKPASNTAAPVRSAAARQATLQAERPRADADQSDQPQPTDVGKTLTDQQIDLLLKTTALQARRGEDGIIQGYVIGARGSDLLLRRLGLQSGDVLLEVAGTPMDSGERIAELEHLLKQSQRLELVVERDGSRETLNFVYSSTS